MIDNLDEWNRKDADPTITIDNIKKILRENGIDTHTVDSKHYGDYWASARIEFNSLAGIGANGKGIGISYTLASAYGELIERIQGGSLIPPLFGIKNQKIIHLSNEKVHKCLDAYRGYFSLETRQYTDDQLYEMLEAYPAMQQMEPYYDVKDNAIVQVPERFLGFICGTNGIAAGNTYEEAFCQGLCEIFERYIMKKIYTNRSELKWPTIPRDLYLSTNSMKMIEQIEAKGYVCIVKNCTMNGILPVVGILVLDSTKTKYLFRLGSDLNFDLALQRCITEVFQGINFDVTFRMQMQSIFGNGDELSSIWNYSDPAEGITRAITAGNGILPYSLFFNQESSNLEPFIMTNDTNESMLIELLKIFNRLNSKLLIKDFSYLGFPTLHLFVPEISNAYYYENNMDYLPVLKAIGRLGQTLGAQENKFQVEQARILLNDLLLIRNYETFKYNTTLNKFTGICLSKDYTRELIDIDYVIGLLALSVRQYECAKKHLQTSFMMDSYIKNMSYKYISLAVDAISNGISQNDTINVMRSLQVSENIIATVKRLYLVHDYGYIAFYCNDCDSCQYVSDCSYNYWNNLYIHLRKKEKAYNESNPYSSIFFKSIAAKLESNE